MTQTPLQLGSHLTTQCYVSKVDQTYDKDGRIIGKPVIRTDQTYTYFIYRSYSDHRSSQLLIRLNPGGR